MKMSWACVVAFPIFVSFYLSFLTLGNALTNNSLQTNQLIRSEDSHLTYQNDTFSFKIDYPSAWIVAENNPELLLRVKDGVVNFFSPPKDFSDAFSENLNVVVSKLDKAEPTSLDGLPEVLAPAFKEIFGVQGPLSSHDVSLDGNPAKKIAFTYNLFNRMVENTQVYSIKSDNVYVITYVCDVSTCSTYTPIFEKMINSFKFT